MELRPYDRLTELQSPEGGQPKVIQQRGRRADALGLGLEYDPESRRWEAPGTNVAAAPSVTAG